MADPAAPTVPAAAFVDNGVPYGSRYELFKTGPSAGYTALAWFLLESISPSRPGVGPMRPNPIGGPNGFVLVGGQQTMSAKAQIPTSATAPLAVGSWFQDSFAVPGAFNPGLPSTGGTEETWVVSSTGERYEHNGYWYQDITLNRAISPP